MPLTRTVDLTEPPVVGEFYLVPTVLYEWHDITRPWPVFPSFHEDADHLNYPWLHYHVDPRFVPDNMLRAIEGRAWRDFPKVVQAVPLTALKDRGRRTDIRPSVEVAATQTVPHPAILWKRRKCYREDPEYEFGHASTIERLRASYAGQTCPKNKAGWVCPHKSYPLGSHAPDERGIITCPLHGLRIEAATGKVLPPPEPPRATPTFGEALAAKYEGLPRDPATGRPVIA